MSTVVKPDEWAYPDETAGVAVDQEVVSAADERTKLSSLNKHAER